MLRLIRIQNLAVIESIEVEFSPGFNVLTGETGAGKSIVADAVDLLLGGRASSDLVRTGQAQATIEAAFEAGRPRADPAPGAHGAGAQPLLRRRAAGHGGATARAGRRPGGPARPARAAAAAGSRDAPGDGWTNTAGWSRPAPGWPNGGRSCGGCGTPSGARPWTRGSGRRGWSGWRSRSRSSSRSSRAKGRTRRCSPRSRCCSTPTASSGSVERATICWSSGTGRCRALWAACGSGSTSWRRSATASGPYAEGRRGIADFLDELGRTFQSTGEAMEDAGERLARVEDRLAKIDRLKRQHGPGMADVLERWRAAVAERGQLAGNQRARGARACELAAAERAFLDEARALSRQRRDRGRPVGPGDRGGAGAIWRWRTRGSACASRRSSAADRWSEQGVDAAEFLVSANVGEEVRPLAKVASGGELSRIMLALHAVGLDGGEGGPGRGSRARPDADLRRGGRGHRRRRGRRGGRAAAGAGRSIPGDQHHAPAGDRGPGRHPLRRREAGGEGPDAHAARVWSPGRSAWPRLAGCWREPSAARPSGRRRGNYWTRRQQQAKVKGTAKGESESRSRPHDTASVTSSRRSAAR